MNLVDKNNKLTDLRINDIKKYQMNRHPFLFIDFIEEVVPSKYAIGHKNFTYNEWFSASNDVVPSFIISESCEQVFLMTFLTIPEYIGKKTSTLSFDVNFIHDVNFGQSLMTKAELISLRRGLAIGKCFGYVNDILVCQAKYTLCIPEVMQQYTPNS